MQVALTFFMLTTLLQNMVELIKRLRKDMSELVLQVKDTITYCMIFSLKLIHKRKRRYFRLQGIM